MGLPVYNMHDPSVAPTHDAMAPGKEPSLQELMIRKDKLEEELKALGSVLDSHGVNMQTSLTTFDGYPRADIDVPQSKDVQASCTKRRNLF